MCDTFCKKIKFWFLLKLEIRSQIRIFFLCPSRNSFLCCLFVGLKTKVNNINPQVAQLLDYYQNCCATRGEILAARVKTKSKYYGLISIICFLLISCQLQFFCQIIPQELRCNDASLLFIPAKKKKKRSLRNKRLP